MSWTTKDVVPSRRGARTRSSHPTGRKILTAASEVEFEEDRTRILLAAVEASWAQDGKDGHLYMKYRCVSSWCSTPCPVAGKIFEHCSVQYVRANARGCLVLWTLQAAGRFIFIVDMRTSLERFSGDVVRERVVTDPPQPAEGTGSEDAGATKQTKKGRSSG